MNAQMFPTDTNYEGAQFPPPRDFQSRAHDQLREGFKAGHRRQLLVAPTGAGKTYLGLRVCHEALAKGRRALFVCDRIALINQTSARADEYGLSAHGVIQSSHWRTDLSFPMQIASVQTLRCRRWPDAHVIVVDEAHTQYPTWTEYVKKTAAAVVGLTATPCSRGLGLIFTNMVNAATMDELTKAGVLVPMRVLTCVQPDLKNVELDSGGEWADRAVAEREAEIVGDVVGEWLRSSEQRKTIAFGADIAYCKLLVERFVAAGVPAATFTSETSEREREYLLKQFTQPNSKLRVLVSVEALAKGFDVPDIGCVIDARPLRKSLSTAIQMWGRGLRSSPGKTDCILQDHSGNIQRFLKDFEQIYHQGFTSLSMAEKLDKAARDEEESEYTPGACPECGHKPFLRTCMACGFEKPTKVLENVEAGQMREIVIGKSVIASDKHDLWRQVCAYARGHSKPEKQAGRAFHLYLGITGEKPAWTFNSTNNAPVSRGTLNKIKSMDIAYRMGIDRRKQHGQVSLDEAWEATRAAK